MRLARPALALGIAAALLLGGSAVAATKVKPVCNLISDRSGDADDPLGTGLNVLSPLNDASVDILGGDFATDKTTLTTVLKLAQAPGLDPHSPQGNYYLSEFQPSSSTDVLYLQARSDTTGALTYSVGHITADTAATRNFNTDAGIPVRGQLTGTTITMSVSLSALKGVASIKPGSKISGIKAETFGGIDLVATGLLFNGDDTSVTVRPYVAGTPSCVKPVK